MLVIKSNLMNTKKVTCSECSNEVIVETDSKESPLCESYLDEKYREAAVSICNTCWLGQEPCICGDNPENLSDENEWGDECEDDYHEDPWNDRCYHINSYIDDGGFEMCEDCGECID